MRTAKARFHAVVFGALFLAGHAGLLRADEQKPLNDIHLQDVQAYDAGTPIPEPAPRAVVQPPVPLDRKNYIPTDERFVHGKPNPNKPFSDLRLSPVYQSWLYFFENGATTPDDLRDEWILVGAVSFEDWAGDYSCLLSRGHACRKSYVVTNPDGLRLCVISGGERDFLPKSTLEFRDQTVIASEIDGCASEDKNKNPVHSPYISGYSKGSDSVNFHNAAAYSPLSWECRIFKNDESKLICKAQSTTDDWYEGMTYFLVYSRDDGKDLFAPMDAIVKPFAAPAAILIKASRKN